jgi:hypothetical protein
MVVLYLATIVLGYSVPELTRPSNADVEKLIEWDGFGAIIETNLPTFLVLFALNILIPIGLYRFSSTARMLFALYTAGTVALTLIWGYRITSPLVNAIGFISALLQGALLTAAYISPLSQRFVARDINNSSVD